MLTDNTRTYNLVEDAHELNHFNLPQGVNEVESNSMLGCLNAIGIMEVHHLDPKHLLLEDGCDHYYKVVMGKKELLGLSEELRQLAEQLED